MMNALQKHLKDINPDLWTLFLWGLWRLCCFCWNYVHVHFANWKNSRKTNTMSAPWHYYYGGIICAYTVGWEIKGKTQMLGPYSEWIQWLCYPVGGILLVWLGSTANQFKIVLSPHLYLMWNISILMGVVPSRMTVPHPQDIRGHWMVW